MKQLSCTFIFLFIYFLSAFGQVEKKYYPAKNAWKDIPFLKE